MGGNGLGLSIAKELTEEMGGSIDAYSSPGEGLTMLLTFPKYKEPKKKKQTPV